MVCLYCRNDTRVVNSRSQKRINKVWRRRQCQSCGAIFTTIEQNAYEGSLMFKDRESHITPFKRDELFISIYDACRHRPQAVSDATAITDTVLGKLQKQKATINAVIERSVLLTIVSETLGQLDNAAQVQYHAYHHP